MKKNKKFYLKTNIISFIIGGILVSGFGVYAAVTFPSNEVSYDNSSSGLSSTNVKGAIDELYETCTTINLEDLLPSNPDELYKDEHGDIRYYGKSPNNYVSFNNELWRIIGVIDGKIKIIRNESIGNYAWASNGSNNWNNASLKTYLNGTYYNSIDGTYKNMISEETYYLGGANSTNYRTLNTSKYYNAERKKQAYGSNPTSTTQYIGLMYPSDYGYAAGESCLSTALYNYDVECKNSDYLYIGVDEWAQSPNISNGGSAARIDSSGFCGNTDVELVNTIRPALYLSSEVKITGGNGSQSNPYTIERKSL